MDNTSSDNLIIKKFEDLDITVYGTFDNPLFKANDIGDLLGIKHIRDTISKLDDDCKVLKAADSIGGLQEQWFLTEDGLYEILFISRKPIAKQFKVWVRNIIKEIRKTGKYEVQKNIENITKSNMLIEQFSNKSVNYIGIVKEINIDESIVKYGETNHVEDTLKRHKTTYGNQFRFIHATECDRPKYLERQIQIHNDTVSRHVKEYEGQPRKELIRLDKNFTKTDLINLMETIKQSMKIQGSIALELEREKTKQMETELENKKEETRQMEIKSNIELKKLEFEIMKYQDNKNSTKVVVNSCSSTREDSKKDYKENSCSSIREDTKENPIEKGLVEELDSEQPMYSETNLPVGISFCKNKNTFIVQKNINKQRFRKSFKTFKEAFERLEQIEKENPIQKKTIPLHIHHDSKSNRYRVTRYLNGGRHEGGTFKTLQEAKNGLIKLNESLAEKYRYLN